MSNAGPIDKKSMKSLLKAKTNIAMLPGGFDEATLYEYKKHSVYIKKRKGFIKYALQVSLSDYIQEDYSFYLNGGS